MGHRRRRHLPARAVAAAVAVAASGPTRTLTQRAKADEGLFKVHRVGDNIYFEIPKAELGKDLLWVTQIKRTTLGAGYGGQSVAERVVRWELNNTRVFLKHVNYDVVADSASPVAQAVADANQPAIIRGVQRARSRVRTAIRSST